MVSVQEQEKPFVEKRIEDPAELGSEGVGGNEGRKELEGYLEKIEREVKKEPVLDDTNGQVVLTPTQNQQVAITLPLTDEEIRLGLHHKIVDSVRWLAEWCIRIAKKAALLGIRVVYRRDT